MDARGCGSGSHGGMTVHQLVLTSLFLSLLSGGGEQQSRSSLCPWAHMLDSDNKKG